MLVRLFRRTWQFLFAPGPEGDYGSKQCFPIRWNLLIIALLIAALNGGIIFLTYTAITQSGEADNQFVTGALIGLLPVGITGLVGLGTTLLNERRRGRGRAGVDERDE